jgi:hypothetical protein
MFGGKAIKNTGKQGDRGPKGEPGQAGAQGAQGVAGPKGDRGEPGRQGVVGPKGDQGPRGLKGDPGPKGERGSQGAQGPKGERGEQGAPGKDGLQGKQGLEGKQGPKGDTGLQGLQGERGLRGEPGLPGIPGERGEKGNPGKDAILSSYAKLFKIRTVTKNRKPCPVKTFKVPKNTSVGVRVRVLSSGGVNYYAERTALIRRDDKAVQLVGKSDYTFMPKKLKGTADIGIDGRTEDLVITLIPDTEQATQWVGEIELFSDKISEIGGENDKENGKEKDSGKEGSS